MNPSKSPILSEYAIDLICARDVQHAECLFEAGEPLPWWAWSALVGKWTGILTCHCGLNSDGKPVGVVSGGSWGLNSVWHGGIQWRSPQTIAKRGSVWDVASQGKMSGWCLLLTDDHERRFACEYNLYGRTRTPEESADDPSEDVLELAQLRDRVRQQLLGNHGIGLRLIGDDRS